MTLCQYRPECSPGGARKSAAASPATSCLRSGVVLHLLLASLLLLPVSHVEATSKKKDPAYLVSTVGGSGGVYTLYTVTGCSECTVNRSQRWCPSTMRCYAADNCTCEGPVPCIDLRTCFYGSRPTCRECVDSGGVYCAGGLSALSPHSSSSGRRSAARCYPPESLAAAPTTAAVGEGEHQSQLALRGAGAQATLPICDLATCRGGDCIRVAAECPAEEADPLMRSYEVIGVIAVLVLSGMVLRNLGRLLL